MEIKSILDSFGNEDALTTEVVSIVSTNGDECQSEFAYTESLDVTFELTVFTYLSLVGIASLCSVGFTSILH